MRIRQIVFDAHELPANAERLAALLALDPPYADPGVGEFGLHNAVFVLGDQFVEIVAPTRAGTAAGRLLERRGDSGYMLILQTADFDRERTRLDAPQRGVGALVAVLQQRGPSGEDALGGGEQAGGVGLVGGHGV